MSKPFTMDAQSLLDFVNHELLINRGEREPVSRETDLIDTGVIDSLSLIQLVTHLEKQAHIDIPDEDVTPENFQKIDSILNYLKRRFAQ